MTLRNPPPGRLIRYCVGAVLALVILVALIAYLALRASLPQLSGQTVGLPLRAAASIERDAEGMPTIKAKSRSDLAFATGFAHAQDRFFQMDLMRRAAAGELAQLLGQSLLETDKRLRIHDFRRVAAQVLTDAKPSERAVMAAYASGVNAGLSALGARPWEYFLLRSVPRPWTSEDSMLVAFSMYLDLHDWTGQVEIARAALHDSMPAEMFAFLHPYGTSWDAPMTGGSWRAPAIPSAQVFDIRRTQTKPSGEAARALSSPDPDRVGSNSWAVDGAHSATGAALLANDMHLTLRLPHVWYRARLMVEAAGEAAQDLVGVTLPGLPMLIVGSNGQVAWGFTNSYGDWTDVVNVAADPGNKDRYRFAEGVESYRVRQETIRVRGEPAFGLDVRVTRWGPVIEQDASGNSRVLVWTAHHPRATNLQLLQLEQAASVEQALDVANRAGGPVQNFVAADRSGRIGWTLMGQVPVRANYDSTMPASWQPTGTGWIGWRTPEEYPRILDPAAGRLWTANARVIDAQTWLGFLGDGGYDIGARANQIRDDLLALNGATADDMRKIQLDDRALFLTRWRDLLLTLLTAEAVKGYEPRAQALELIRKWSAQAAVNDPGYRIVRSFRLTVRDEVFTALSRDARRKSPQLRFTPSPQFEGALWQMITEQPPHLLSLQFANWQEAMLYWLDLALADLGKQCESLAECTWGKRNTLSMQHPMSKALPWLAPWLDMPREALPGDSAMPRVQGPAFGASQRMVVSPGRESEGILQLPGGPTDHPLSPFYRAGHEAWSRGEAHPLRPGKTTHTLELRPR